MSEDSQNDQVETLEDAISKVLDEQETDQLVEDDHEEIDEEVAEEVQADDPEEPSADAEEPAERDEDEADEPETETDLEIAAEAETGDIPDDGDDKLAPPEHWSPAQKERFNGLPREGQEFIQETVKNLEGDYTKKTQEISSIRRQFESMQNALSPLEQEFTQRGLTHADAVKHLVQMVRAERANPKQALMARAKAYNIDFSQPDPDEVTDPALKSVLNEIGEIKTSLSRREQEAKHSQLASLQQRIKTFEEETGEDGKLLHPHFREVEADIAKLMNGGMVDRDDLKGGYETAVLLRGLAKPAPPPPPKTNVDRAEKVKQAKRAAAGVKSSGAVGKKERPPAKTWAEEVARHVR